MYHTHRNRRPPGPLDGQCLTGALRRVAPGLLALVSYLLGTLHAWIREGANNFTLGSQHQYRMRDGAEFCLTTQHLLEGGGSDTPYPPPFGLPTPHHPHPK